MTEATQEQTTTLTEALVRHGFYSHYGIVRIAVGDNILADLTGTNTVTVTPNEVTLLEAPGSPAWVDRMARTRTTLVHAVDTAQGEVRTRINHLERLGEALLEEANNRDWCEEYDTFAEEWGLPTRVSQYDITVTVRVEARNEDAAVDLVRENIDLDSYSTDGVVSGPEFDVSSAY